MGAYLYAPVHGESCSAFVKDGLRDLFGVELSTGTVVHMVSRRPRAYGDLVDTVRTGVVQARVKPMDETGLRIGGRLHWLHVECTNLLTHLCVMSHNKSSRNPGFLSH